ncbi:restriction endonuclease subunit S [Vibrio parahaemolyticus]
MTGRYKAYPEYKDSGIDWVGDIPSSWCVKPTYSVFDPSVTKNSDGQETTVLSLSYGRIIVRDVEANFGLLPESFNTYQIVNDGDLILRLTDLQNDKKSLRVGLVKQTGIITSAYLKLHSSEFIEPRFAYRLLHSYDTTKVFYGMGGGLRQSMKFEDFRRLPIIVPPFEEQQRIANFLDHETAKIDTLITKQEKLIELLKEKRQAVISHAVTKGLNPDAPMKDSGVEWLGEVPEHWEIKPAFVTFEPTIQKNNDGKETKVLSLSYGQIVKRNVDTNFGLLPESFNTYQIINIGDLVLRLTDLQNDKKSLRVGLAKQNGIITSAYLKLKCKSMIDSYFAYYLLHSYDTTKVFYGMGGGLRQSMKFEELRRLPVLLPEMKEQHNIVEFLTQKIGKFDSLIEASTKKIELMKERKAALISAAVTGKIDVCDWQGDA